jgi:hypothetical protein
MEGLKTQLPSAKEFIHPSIPFHLKKFSQPKRKTISIFYSILFSASSDTTTTTTTSSGFNLYELLMRPNRFPLNGTAKTFSSADSIEIPNSV